MGSHGRYDSSSPNDSPSRRKHREHHSGHHSSRERSSRHDRDDYDDYKTNSDGHRRRRDHDQDRPDYDRPDYDRRDYDRHDYDPRHNDPRDYDRRDDRRDYDRRDDRRDYDRRDDRRDYDRRDDRRDHRREKSSDFKTKAKNLRDNSKVREAIQLGVSGLGAAFAGREASGHGSRDYDRGRRKSYSDARSHSVPRTAQEKWQRAAKAAIVAGAVEAFRAQKQPGPWKGEKGARVLAVAAGAAGLDGLFGKGGSGGSRGDDSKSGMSKRKLAEAVIGGLVGSRLAGGGTKSRSRSRSRDRSRSRPRHRSHSMSDYLR